MKRENVIGQVYGRLKIIADVKSDKTKRRLVLCRCECGKEVTVRLDSLRRVGNTLSCGCLNRELAAERAAKLNKKHGLSDTRIYKCWTRMKNRCFDKQCNEYSRYGGRGITVCERWRTFENFYEDVSEEYERHVKEYGEQETTIDRIDVNGNYEPGNVRWATAKEQANNKTTNTFITYGGKTMTISQWASELGIDSSTLGMRIHRLGWTKEKSLTTPVRKINRRGGGNV